MLGEKVIRTVKYADDLLLRTNEEVVLQGMFESIIEIVRCCGLEINAKETTVIRMLIHQSHVQIMIDQIQPEIVEYFNYLGGMITKYTICTPDFKYKITLTKAAFNKKKP